MDKVIVITGGSRGIGAATALLAAAQGYRICINYQADEQAALGVLEKVRALGAQAIAVRADVSIEDEVIALFNRVDSELGRVTALVNNAGTVGQKSRVDEMSEFRILKIMKTNVLAPILCAKHAILFVTQRFLKFADCRCTAFDDKSSLPRSRIHLNMSYSFYLFPLPFDNEFTRMTGHAIDANITDRFLF